MYFKSAKFAKFSQISRNLDPQTYNIYLVFTSGFADMEETQRLSQSVELYHPTINFNITLPELPELLDISGFWFDGKLIFCGRLPDKALFEGT